MSRTLSIVLAVLATAAVAPLAAGGAPHPIPASPPGATPAYRLLGGTPRMVTLYDQTGYDSGSADVSQFFGSPDEAYDSQGADDFTVPAGHKWNVQQVKVVGRYFGGTGEASSVNVYILKDQNGRPGAVKAEFFYLAPTGGSGDPSFTINLPKTVTLRPGTFWLSVQPNMSFDYSGEWGWEMSTAENGNTAMWQNPGNGFGTGCVTWTPVQTCISTSGGPDFMFALMGADRVR